MLELQTIHGDIDVHIQRTDGKGEAWTEDVWEVRSGRPRENNGARGTAIVAVIEGE